ncbi:MAG: hypothetical protein GF344_13340, partial [Chitinivibrionales bacterium]|nr:hypothetical protein [Chitinivibrionales bacterium]MBD3357714.1 hypothetical protein [Chitinivibrionales bacterium]
MDSMAGLSMDACFQDLSNSNGGFYGHSHADDACAFKEALYGAGKHGESGGLASEFAHPTDKSHEIGTTIRDNIARMSKDFDAEASKYHEAYEEFRAVEHFDMKSALRLQHHMLSLSYKQQLSAKVGELGSEGVKTLFRN